ncbi:MAG: HNH endonuclease [Thermodesulfovibrionales bacterium]|nr:HNH endonuclease [Thermodesulfovibrionales bacterium]
MDWDKLKKFKNQFHLVRSAVEAMPKKDIGFSFNFEINKGANINLRLPPKHEIARFATVIKPLADPGSRLNYKDIATLLLENGFIPSSDKELFDKEVQLLETGPILLELKKTGERLRGLDFYLIYSKGEFFDEKEIEANRIKDLHGYLIIPQYMIYAFYSYCFDVYKLCEYLYNIIREAEKTKHIPEPNNVKSHQCIYCLTKTGSFKSEEHVYPESLGNTEVILPPGQVCDNCNNGVLSELDQQLVEHDIISFLRTLVLPYNPKTGKFLTARYQNMAIEKISPREIIIKQNNPKFGLNMEETGEHVRGTLSMQGRKKFDPKLLGRSLYKIALGIICIRNGLPMALDCRYDTARDFILGKRSFPNNLFISKQCTPCGHIEGTHFILNPGTPFIMNIFGVAFLFNLEPEPLMKIDNELDKENFQRFSLSGHG